MNRINTDLNQWHTREERFGKLFSFSLSSNIALAKEKLTYYGQIAVKYRGTKDPDERLTLKMLRYERSHLEKKLYPNLLLRMLHRVLVAPVKQQIIVRQDNRKLAGNSQALHQEVQRTGFPDLSVKIDEQIMQKQQQFSIPVSYYLNDKERVDHELSFVKDQFGQYHFEGYKTALYNEAKPDEKRQQYFSMRHEHIVNTTEAYNLLSGRCIQNGGTWLQLNLNDKDQHGHFRVKQFHSDYGYDLDNALQQLPLKELQNAGETGKLNDALKNGEKSSVSFVRDGNEQRFYIEANPQFKTVNIYDEHSRKITLHTAIGNKTMDAMKVAHKVNERQQQQLSKKNGIKVC